MFSLSGNWLKWRRGRQKPPSRTESVFNVCGRGAVRAWACANVCWVWEAETRGGCTVMEGQAPPKVGHVWSSSRLSGAQILSDLRRPICSPNWKAMDAFEHIFSPERELNCIYRGSRPNYGTCYLERPLFFEKKIGILLLLLQAREGLAALLCPSRARVSPHHHHHHLLQTCLCSAISDVTSAQGCFLSGCGSKQLIWGKSQSVLEAWPSLLRQNT